MFLQQEVLLSGAPNFRVRRVQMEDLSCARSIGALGLGVARHAEIARTGSACDLSRVWGLF